MLFLASIPIYVPTSDLCCSPSHQGLLALGDNGGHGSREGISTYDSHFNSSHGQAISRAVNVWPDKITHFTVCLRFSHTCTL